MVHPLELIAVLDRTALETRAVVTVRAGHVRGRVLMGNDVDGVGEFRVRTAVVPVSVGIDDRRDRLIGDLPDLGQDVRTIPFDLGVDEDHAVGPHKDCGVAAGAHPLLGRVRREHVQVIR